MKLTKDECRILAAALGEAKYELVNRRSITTELIDKLNGLEDRLHLAGMDKRRKGRTSMNDFDDCLKRFARA